MNFDKCHARENNRLSYLNNLFYSDELPKMENGISSGGTPLWQCWKSFVCKSLLLSNSPLTLKGTRDKLKYLIRQTGIVSIEEMEGGFSNGWHYADDQPANPFPSS